MLDTFDSVYVINLNRRPDRLLSFRERFPESWPFLQPVRVAGIDGERVPKPHWYSQQAGAWSCLQVHLRLYERALSDNQDIFIFEDDCVFAADFDDRIRPFFDHLPSDWQMVYLGGLHRMPHSLPPIRVNDHVWRARAVTTTYAYGIRAEFLRELYPLLHEVEQHHIDQMLARLQAENNWNIYCPVPWLVGMDAGPSDICGRYYARPHFWEYRPSEQDGPFYLQHLISRVRYRDGVCEEVPLTAQQQKSRLESSIPGWFSAECAAVYRRECQAAAKRNPGHRCRLAEVGCWRGRSLSFLADLIRSGEVQATAVDTWKGNSDPRDPTHGKDVYEEFKSNMQRLGIGDLIKIFRGDYRMLTEHWSSLNLYDVVMIDADHEYSHVKQDLDSWWKCVRPGGVLVGHDYSPACGCPGVVKAVQEFAALWDIPIEAEADMWLLRRPVIATVPEAVHV